MDKQRHRPQHDKGDCHWVLPTRCWRLGAQPVLVTLVSIGALLTLTGRACTQRATSPFVEPARVSLGFLWQFFAGQDGRADGCAVAGDQTIRTMSRDWVTWVCSQCASSISLSGMFAVLLLATVVLTITSGGSSEAASGKGPVVLGEHFVTRVITDPGQGGMSVGVVSVPESWRFKSNIVWNYAHYSSPVTTSSSTENPTNEEAVYGYPAAQFFTVRPAMGYYRPGQNVGGLVFAEPVPAVQALAQVIQQIRGGSTRLQFVGSKNLSDLPAAMRLPASPNQQGVGIKVSYNLNGKPVEEEFYGVYYAVQIPYDGPQGRTWQVNWGLAALHSFRGPAGTLDARRPVFAVIAKSFRPNPVWLQRLVGINTYLAAEFNRQLQAGYDQIAAAAALSREISKNNDTMIASIERQRQASSATSPNATTGSEQAKFDDYVRGVDTVDDPYYGTSQHASTEQFHWTDGYGNYRNSNDVTYDPNRSEVGQWQLMRPGR